MTNSISGNLLVLQSGIPGVVGNSTLYGVITEALNYENVEEVYGVYNGFEGLQKEDFLDLAALSQQAARMLLHTAGFSLGSESTTFAKESYDFNRMVKALKSRDIRFLCCIGDKASLGLVQSLIDATKAENYDVRVTVVPHSNINELPITDHSLGYGSYLKYLNAHLGEFDHSLRTNRVKVGICEVSGGSTGWVAAGAALSKGKQAGKNEHPFVLCLPEQPFEEELLLSTVAEKIKACGYALIVTNHCLVNEQGEYLSLSNYSGSAACYLNTILQESMSTNAQLNFCSLHTLPLSHFISKQDQAEAVASGKEAVVALVKEGKTELATVVLRKESEVYGFEISFVSLQEMSTGTKFLPIDWILESSLWINYAFIKYANPLIQGEVAVGYERGLPHLVHF